jgi:hypothetical protein
MMRQLIAVAVGLACGDAFAGGSMQAQQAGVAYYTSHFDGGEARFDNFECKAPVFPAVSNSNDSVRRVERSVRLWRSCFSRWQEKMVAVLPAGKAIPDEVVKAMTPADMAKARESMGQTYRNIIEAAFAEDQKVNAGIASWMKATGANGGHDLTGQTRVRFEPPADGNMMMRRWREGLPGGPL